MVDALRRELRDVDDTTRSFDDFFFFLRRKEDRSNYLFIYLFFRLIFYFSLLDYLYMYMYMYFFSPPFLEKEEILVSVRRGQEIMYHLFSMRRCFSCIFLVFSVN